ncbi:MAG: hypothetical protein H0U75_12635 [Legionella sp.]|nr:hypothetical protein [Legionella sp.]
METWLSYYHPSTVVFVDDHQAFLTAVQNKLSEQMHALFFNNSRQALTTLNNKTSQYQKLQHIQDIEEEVEFDASWDFAGLYNINLKPLNEISAKVQRFSEISVR